MLPRIAVGVGRGRRHMAWASAHDCAYAVSHRAGAPLTAAQRRTIMSVRGGGNGSKREAFDTLNVERMSQKRREYERTRLVFLASGSVAGLIAMGYTAWQIKKALERSPTKLDATGTPGQSGLAPRKVIVHDKDGREIVPTGNSTVPEFPRTVDLPLALFDSPSTESAGTGAADDAAVTLITAPTVSGGPSTEYTLVGFGLRTVSFLSIQVYIVGFYIATADIAALQNRLIKRVNPIATTLVPGEKDELRTTLLDPADGQTLWESLLEDGIPARSLFRIVPVRDTDFPHLRDGLVRAIQARAPRLLEKEKGQQETAGAADGTSANPAGPDFGESVREFRRAFNRGKAPKQRELLLVRGADGTLSIVFDDGRSMGRQRLGSVGDERISRALWLNYLCGPKVASEPARHSIMDGVIEFVERPIGTVATQVV